MAGQGSFDCTVTALRCVKAALRMAAAGFVVRADNRFLLGASRLVGMTNEVREQPDNEESVTNKFGDSSAMKNK